MKKKYTGMNMVIIPFETSDTIVTIKSTCFHIVANTVSVGANTCSNPTDTTTYMWYGDNPFE